MPGVLNLLYLLCRRHAGPLVAAGTRPPATVSRRPAGDLSRMSDTPPLDRGRMMWRRGARGGWCTFGWSGRSSVAPRIGPGRAAGASRRGSPRRARARGRVLAPQRCLRRPPDDRDQRVLPRSRLRLPPCPLCAAGHRTARRAGRRHPDVRGADRQAGPAPRPPDSTSSMGRIADAVHFARGFDYAEGAVGTNGVGTVLESGESVHIVGGEHFADVPAALRVRGRSGARPVHRAAGGRAGHQLPGEHSSPIMHSLVRSAAAHIEHDLLADRNQLQQALFDVYTRVDARSRLAVLAVGERTVMANSADAEPARAGRPRGPAGLRPLRDAPPLTVDDVVDLPSRQPRAHAGFDRDRRRRGRRDRRTRDAAGRGQHAVPAGRWASERCAARERLPRVARRLGHGGQGAAGRRRRPRHRRARHGAVHAAVPRVPAGPEGSGRRDRGGGRRVRRRGRRRPDPARAEPGAGRAARHRPAVGGRRRPGCRR